MAATALDSKSSVRKDVRVQSRLRYSLSSKGLSAVTRKEPSKPFSAEFWPGVDRQV